jgi:hypothetical protein
LGMTCAHSSLRLPVWIRGWINTTLLDERASMASDQDPQDPRLRLVERPHEPLMSPELRRSVFLYGAVGYGAAGAADVAVLYLFFSPRLTGLRLDTGARALLYVTVTSLGLVMLAIALSSLRLLRYQLVAPYVLVAGALCTAVAFELLLAQLDTGAFWLLLPWLVITAVVIAVPVLRRASAIWRSQKVDRVGLPRAARASIAAQWRQVFAR